MKIRRAPIEDLLIYFEEEGEKNTGNYNILKLIAEHYKMLSDYNISFRDELIYENWCFCDCGKIINNGFPYVEGLLVNRNKNEFGVTFSGIRMRGPASESQEKDMWVWIVNDKGELIAEPFHHTKWENWGAMTRFYDYQKQHYTEGFNSTLGSRSLSLGNVGADVMILQHLLLNFGENMAVNGEFDAETVKALISAQTAFQLSPTGKFEKNKTKIIDYLLRN